MNGDAEIVAWWDYRKAGDQSGGKIAGEGAIDVPEVRDAIVGPVCLVFELRLRSHPIISLNGRIRS